MPTKIRSKLSYRITVLRQLLVQPNKAFVTNIIRQQLKQRKLVEETSLAQGQWLSVLVEK